MTSHCVMFREDGFVGCSNGDSKGVKVIRKIESSKEGGCKVRRCILKTNPTLPTPGVARVTAFVGGAGPVPRFQRHAAPHTYQGARAPLDCGAEAMAALLLHHAAAPAIARLIAPHLGWDDAEAQRQVQAFVASCADEAAAGAVTEAEFIASVRGAS